MNTVCHVTKNGLKRNKHPLSWQPSPGAVIYRLSSGMYYFYFINVDFCLSDQEKP